MFDTTALESVVGQDMKRCLSVANALFLATLAIGDGNSGGGNSNTRGGTSGPFLVAGFLAPRTTRSTSHQTVISDVGTTSPLPRSRSHVVDNLEVRQRRRKSCYRFQLFSLSWNVNLAPGRPSAAGPVFARTTPADMDAEWARILEDDDEDDDDDGDDGDKFEEDDDEDYGEDDEEDDLDEWELPTSGPGKEAADDFEAEIDRVLRGDARSDFDYDSDLDDVEGDDENGEEGGREVKSIDDFFRAFHEELDEDDHEDEDEVEGEDDCEDEDDHEEVSAEASNEGQQHDAGATITVQSDEELLLGYQVRDAGFSSSEDSFYSSLPPSIPRPRYKDYLKAKRAKEAAWLEKRKTFSAAHNAYIDEVKRNREAAAARKEWSSKKFFKKKKIFNYVAEKEKQAEREAIWAGRWPRNITRSMESLEEGEWLEGKVRNVESYGAWVDVGVERDGLLHVRDMGETFTARASDVVSTRDKIFVRVKFSDPATGKLALSMVKDVPVENELPRPPPLPRKVLAEIEPGTELWGFVERVTNVGAYVNVGAEVQGFLHIKEVPGREKGADAPQVLRKHKRLRVYAMDVDVPGNRIKLTCRRPMSKPRCSPQPMLASQEFSNENVYDDSVYMKTYGDSGGVDDIENWDDHEDDEEDVDWFYEDREQPTSTDLQVVG